MYIVSKCLLGENCKYSGGNNRCKEIIEFLKGNSYFAVCPEERGGLTTPRPPAEIIEGRVINSEGTDVTEAFLEGARLSLKEALSKAEGNDEKIEGAILKAYSPSCGAGMIYDGTFSHTKIEGDGCFAEMLRGIGLDLKTEEDFIK